MSQTPAWLERLGRDQSRGPRLYAWTTENLGRDSGAATRSGHDAEPVADGSGSADLRGRIHILGLGNLGRLYASCLAQMADRPKLSLVVHRRALLEHWAARPGIDMFRPGQPEAESTSAYDLEWWTEQRPETGPVREVCSETGGRIEHLVVATKATNALDEVDRLRRYLDAASTVAFVHNGMSRLWPPHGAAYGRLRYGDADDGGTRRAQHPNWLHCVTTHGVVSRGPFASVHTSPADVRMGPVLLNPHTGGRAEFLLARLGAAPGLAARRVSRSALWVAQLEKLVVNAVINPLTAVLGCQNGALFAGRTADGLAGLIGRLLEEASGVLQALVMHEANADLVCEEDAREGEDVVVADKAGGLARNRQILVERFSTERLETMLRRVGEKVRDNTSSMLQDVQAGKGTEVGEFNGWLVETAGCLGIRDVTGHGRLMSLVERGATMSEQQLVEYMARKEECGKRALRMPCP
ncbi:hypothetical protein P8C59_006671 [Phyllachora maydis]|uniref:2-dehydropantoate 2-reductase n=1 Tax=Phyllachora maydis TaxID=1825666 RepID=A0AAD9I770_9PEZI|nr:hypothetical protein P8C59_006671 [Phyllachora maydis]